jgi:hypothetical protein
MSTCTPSARRPSTPLPLATNTLMGDGSLGTLLLIEAAVG